MLHRSGAPTFASTTIQTTPVNDPPVANAGPDQTVTSGDTVNLTGAASSDPNGDPLTFAWTQPSGPVVTLSGANTATPSFTAPSVTTNTDLTFSLQVCDPEPLCSTDTVVVTVQPQPTVNVPPVANAGPDQTVTSGDTVNLTGAASSDPNGDTLTFAWTQPSGPVVTLSGANTATPSFTAPSVTTNTDLTFSLQVCDPEPLCSTDTVVVTVQPQPTVNVPPVANAGPDQTVTSGDTVNLTGAASSDPNGDTLTFAWTQPSGPA